jgi:hypothetical protein
MWIIRFGFSCVDVFFVLTGFLLTYPYFLKEFQLNAKLKQQRTQALAQRSGLPADDTTRVTSFQFNKAKQPAAAVGAAAAAAAADSSVQQYDTSVFTSVRARDYWYKRFVVRIYPPLIIALIIHCYILFPSTPSPPPSSAHLCLTCLVVCCIMHN